MRILVGTLFTIENEIELCKKSIREQNYDDYEHIIIEGLPNKQAHKKLYKTFMEKSDSFDLLVKVDADMVLKDQDFFSKVVEKFEKNEKLKDLEIAVHDCFSGANIWGLHIYRSDMRWEDNSEDLFVDSYQINDRAHVKDAEDLAPAALHSPDPSSFQSFHYGVHQGLKSIYPRRKYISGKSVVQFWMEKILRTNRWGDREEDTESDDTKNLPEHWERMGRVRGQFEAGKRERQKALILLGFELALLGKFSPEDIDNTDPYLRNFFSRNYEGKSVEELEEIIERLRLRNFDFLPKNLRRRLLNYMFEAGIRGNLWG